MTCLSGETWGKMTGITFGARRKMVRRNRNERLVAESVISETVVRCASSLASFKVASNTMRASTIPQMIQSSEGSFV